MVDIYSLVPYILKYVNILIIFIIILLLTRYIVKVGKNPARKPWEYMMYAMAVLLVINSLKFLNLNAYDFYRDILETIFLLIFIIVIFIQKKNFDNQVF